MSKSVFPLLGNIKVTYYKKNIFGKWKKTKEEVRSNQQLSANHWKTWERFDSNDGVAKLKCRKGLMDKYVTVSPLGDDKVVYERL